MASRDTLIDGDFVRPTQVGPRRYTFPFLSNGDRVSCYFEEDYWQTEATFAPGTVGVSHESFRDFILIAESPPIALHAGIVSFTRTWSRVPATQTIDSTIMVAKPSVSLGSYPGQLGSYIVFKPDSTLEKYDAYRKQVVTSDSGSAATAYPTGGTYTLTFGANTTAAIAYNASSGTVQTELNALASITARGGVTVTGSYNSAGGLVITFANKSQISIDSSSLTGGSVSETEVSSNGGYTQTVGAVVSDTMSAVTGNVSSLTSVGGGSSTLSDTANGSYERQIWIYAAADSINGGTYTLTVLGNTTSALAYNASFSDIETALNALGVGTFSVFSTYGYPTAYYNYQMFFTIRRVSATIGGTFTLTALGQTTGSIAASASASTVETALNALANVTSHGGVTVSGTMSGGYAISFSNNVITAGNLLAPSGATVTPSVTDGSIGAAQKIVFSGGPGVTRTIYCAGHGLAASDWLYVKAASNYYTVSPSVFTVPDANTILLQSTAGTAYSTADTITEVGKRTKLGYTTGSVPIPCSLVTRFSTSAITPDQYKGDDVTLLQEIFAGTTSINYRVGDSIRWPFELSPIRSLTTTQISASNL